MVYVTDLENHWYLADYSFGLMTGASCYDQRTICGRGQEENLLFELWILKCLNPSICFLIISKRIV